MTTPSPQTGPTPISFDTIVEIGKRIDAIEKEVKSLRGMVFLSMKKQSTKKVDK